MLVLYSGEKMEGSCGRFTSSVCECLFCSVFSYTFTVTVNQHSSVRFVISVLKRISSEDFESKL